MRSITSNVKNMFVGSPLHQIKEKIEKLKLMSSLINMRLNSCYSLKRKALVGADENKKIAVNRENEEKNDNENVKHTMKNYHSASANLMYCDWS